jgi:mycofactocin precursor
MALSAFMVEAHPEPEAPMTETVVATDLPDATESEGEPVLVEADLLVEDVSIDGMCGVY